MYKPILIVTLAFGVIIWGCEKMAAPAVPEGRGNDCTPASPDSIVTYDNYVKNVMAAYCTGSCHNGDASSPGNFRTYDGILPYTSEFYIRVIQDRADMPQGNAPLPRAIRDSLNIWINNCAPEK